MPKITDLAELAMAPTNQSPLASIAQQVADATALRFPKFEFPHIPPNALVTSVEANHASEFHRRLIEWIASFDQSLDQEHEVGIRLVSFGQAIVFRLEDLGYWNPSLISFKGQTEDGQPVELIQHVTQISVLLMRLPRADPTAPKKPIGFHCENA